MALLLLLLLDIKTRELFTRHALENMTCSCFLSNKSNIYSPILKVSVYWILLYFCDPSWQKVDIYCRWLQIIFTGADRILITLQFSHSAPANSQNPLSASLLLSYKCYCCQHLLPCYLSWLGQLLLIFDNLQCLHDPVNHRPCTIWQEKYEIPSPPNLFHKSPSS